MRQETLFEDAADRPPVEPLADGAVVLHRFAAERTRELLTAVDNVASAAPFRHMVTPGGFRMSVAMTNCGTAGWVSDKRGYRYDEADPQTEKPWPAMPSVFVELAATGRLSRV